MSSMLLSEGGGSYELRLSHRENDLLHGFCAAPAAHPRLHLLARVFDAARGRYEIEFEVEQSFFHTRSESLVHLTVTNVRHRKARRASPRWACRSSWTPASATAGRCRATRRSRCA